MIGYHFTQDTLRDGRPIPPIGEWLEHDGPIVPCESGLHASSDPYDALDYARGPMLHKVELEGDLVAHGNPASKWCGRRRRILASLDATDLLRQFARWCALQVVDLWDAPDVVRRYLETGDESLRAATWDAARDAAWEAARDAAWGAAWGATADAAWGAAWCAAREAASAAYQAHFAEMVDAAFAARGGKGGDLR